MQPVARATIARTGDLGAGGGGRRLRLAQSGRDCGCATWRDVARRVTLGKMSSAVERLPRFGWLVLAFVLAGLVLVAPAFGARRTAKPLTPGNLTSGRIVGLRDRVFRGRAPSRVRRLARTPAGYGGQYLTPSGESVRVITSPQYQPNAAVNQSYADFLDSLVHGDELSSVTVYVAPYDEMQGMCSSDALACYFDADNLLVTTGDGSPQPGIQVEDLVAHEYGHHIANHRLNDIGPASDWGPEYWATYEQVCWREGQGTAFPGDEGANYALNPGEAWAETYRVLNGSQEPWDSSDPSFSPDDRALALARRDVLHPYDGGEYIDRRGRFRSRGSRWRSYTVPVENDGNVDLRLHGTRSLDADLYIFANRNSSKPLASARANGRNEHLERQYCGYRHLDVEVYRYRGTGSYKLRMTLPYFVR